MNEQETQYCVLSPGAIAVKGHMKGHIYNLV